MNPKEKKLEIAAIKSYEAFIWPNGKKCPFCGNSEKIYEIKGKSTRIGLNKCSGCKKQFTVKIGTVFEDSHIPLYKWIGALDIINENPVKSAYFIDKEFGTTRRTSLYMIKRLANEGREGENFCELKQIQKVIAMGVREGIFIRENGRIKLKNHKPL